MTPEELRDYLKQHYFDLFNHRQLNEKEVDESALKLIEQTKKKWEDKAYDKGFRDGKDVQRVVPAIHRTLPIVNPLYELNAPKSE